MTDDTTSTTELWENVMFEAATAGIVDLTDLDSLRSRMTQLEQELTEVTDVAKRLDAARQAAEAELTEQKKLPLPETTVLLAHENNRMRAILNEIAELLHDASPAVVFFLYHGNKWDEPDGKLFRSRRDRMIKVYEARDVARAALASNEEEERA